MKTKLLQTFIRMSKYAFYCMIIQSSLYSFAFSHNSGAQAKKLSEIDLKLNLIEVSLSESFYQIEQQTGFAFAYLKEDLPQTSVTIAPGRKSLEEVLLLISDQSSVSFRRVNETIHVRKSANNPEKIEEIIEMVRPVQITGKILDETGAGLPGATVLEKGTSNGTITDFNGDFQLTVDENATLVVSFVGYQNREEALNGRTAFTLKLEPDFTSLEEVVVVGYGTVKKSDLTGAVSSVDSENFNSGPQLAPQQLIQGKVAGVNISKNSGKPGGSNTIRIRGGTSISASNEPLYVIDGVPISTSSGVAQANIGSSENNNFFDQEPVNPLMTLNPSDIASVIVLKDASATAIYGSRGANGVIMITTKKGREGKAQITYDVSMGLSKVANTLDVLTADEYRQTINDLELTLDDKGANTNWQDEIYQTAFQQNHYVSLSGGSQKTFYRASLGYGNQEGVMLASELTQSNARININHKDLDDKLELDLRVNYGENQSTQSPVSNTLGSELGSSMNYEAYVFNPTYPVYDEDGNFNHVLPFRVNPVSYGTDLQDERANRRFIGNFAAAYKLADPLKFKVNMGYTRQSVDRNSFISKLNPLGEGLGGYASVQKLADFSKLIETTLSFNKNYGKHTVDAVGGYSYQYFRDEVFHNVANGFLSDEFKWYSLQAASNISSVQSAFSSNTLISVYGRVNYNFDNRYFFTGTIRRDGSSRFGEGNKWGTFPSAAVSWKISQEKFFDFAAISDLKLRASYGMTGNQEIGNLNSITTLGASSSGYIVGGQRMTIVLPQQYANPDLRWEQTGQLDIGLNFALFNQRIYGGFDYYRKKTTDLLLSVAVPSPSVVTTQLANVGSVENKGIEIELGFEVVQKKDFSWNANLNYSRNRNKVLELSNDQWQGDDIKTAPIRGAGLAGGYSQLITPGQPLGTFYGYKFLGVVDGVEQFSEEEQIIGNARPDFTYGIGNNLSYKRWSLSLNFRGSVGNDVYNMTANNLGYLTNLPGRNVLQEAVDSGVGRDEAKQYSSRWIEDGSFLRLDNMTVSYNVNSGIAFLSNLRVYLTGQNLFVITKYSGLDPEVNSDVSGTGIAPLGIDYLSYPRAKSVVLGASISF